jgi:hypothetical protein
VDNAPMQNVIFGDSIFYKSAGEERVDNVGEGRQRKWTALATTAALNIRGFRSMPAACKEEPAASLHKIRLETVIKSKNRYSKVLVCERVWMNAIITAVLQNAFPQVAREDHPEA